MSETKKDRGGRPRVDATPITVRVPPAQLAPLDAWIADQPDPKPSRPEALRSALREWLADQLPHGEAEESEESSTSTSGFFVAADGHRDAAKRINIGTIDPQQQNQSLFLGFYHLLGYSVELYLKAFLSLKGVGAKDLDRKFGHKLLKTYNKAVKEGLNDLYLKYKIPGFDIQPSAFESIVKILAKHHGDYTYRYVKGSDYKYNYFRDIGLVFQVLDYIHYIIQEEMKEC